MVRDIGIGGWLVFSENKYLVLTFLVLFALMVPLLYTLLLVFELVKLNVVLWVVQLIIILWLVWFWRRGGVFHDYAGWLLLAWLALTWVVSAFFGFITLEFFEGTAGYVVLLSALTSTALLAISKIFTRRRKTVDQLIKEALEKR